jgi:hypothetical protein
MLYPAAKRSTQQADAAARRMLAPGASLTGDMVFDLECPRCGDRDMRRWVPGEAVTVTYCKRCYDGMSVVGIAFFARSSG